jgi:UDP-GlcNAc:undecaprenyl-phosphate/decaprenyl-phosphate GlcNAc-1-phosphate transferase
MTSDWMMGDRLKSVWISGAPVIAGAISFALVLAATPAVVRLCAKFGLRDSPGPLKIHSGPIPRLGGIAILLAICAGIFLDARSAIDAYFVSALGLIWAVGIVDDLRGLPPSLRLSAQALGGIILWYGGWRVPLLNSGLLGLAALCLYVVTVVNAMNFMDGADGIAAGVTAVIAAGYIALRGGSLSQFGPLLAWSLLGACAGFLIVNFPPAKIFMGDSGSTLLGFCVAILGLDFWRSNGAAGSSPLFPLVVVGLPLMDALLAVLRRLRTGESMLQGDRSHFYDLLLACGLTARKVAFTCYAISLAFVLIGFLILRTDSTFGLWFSLIAAGVLLMAALRLGSLGKTENRPRMQRVKV